MGCRAAGRCARPAQSPAIGRNYQQSRFPIHRRKTVPHWRAGSASRRRERLCTDQIFNIGLAQCYVSPHSGLTCWSQDHFGISMSAARVKCREIDLSAAVDHIRLEKSARCLDQPRPADPARRVAGHGPVAQVVVFHPPRSIAPGCAAIPHSNPQAFESRPGRAGAGQE